MRPIFAGARAAAPLKVGSERTSLQFAEGGLYRFVLDLNGIGACAARWNELKSEDARCFRS